MGCAKNLVDTEVLLKQLDANQFRFILNPGKNDRIDTAIINTCGFILDAKKESVDMILQFVHARKEGLIRRLYVMGCLSERYKVQLQKEIPEVDDYFGVNELKKIVERVGGEYKNNLLGERRITTPLHYSYLKIAEGCDRKCSFCSIPLIRGKHVSVPVRKLIRQAEYLVRQGVKELNVISQDTTYYGWDLYGKKRLPELLASLADIYGLEWIRLHYTYPDAFPLKVLDVIKDRPNVCKYLDIPLQHINTRILKSMRRGIDERGTRELIDTIRAKIPGIAIRTTFMVGYPGETVKEYRELREFVSRSMFDRVGVFTYSHEENTRAYQLKDNVPSNIKQERAGELMEIQQEISFKLNANKVAKIVDILIDREETDYYIGRTEFDSPEIDNEVLIKKSPRLLRIGEFYKVRIFQADSFDLYGEVA